MYTHILCFKCKVDVPVTPFIFQKWGDWEMHLGVTGPGGIQLPPTVIITF